MPRFLQFLTRRLIAIPVTLIIITVLLYGVAMLVPVHIRAKMYWPSSAHEELMTREDVIRLNERITREYGLNDSFPVQYVRWITQLLKGDWGSSFTVHDVPEALIRHTPVTLELTLYSIILMVPLGLTSGVVSGRKKNRPVDYGFRVIAFISTSIPPFILGFVLLAVFYVSLKWFPPGRLGVGFQVSSDFQSYTGLLTIDGWLNGRSDISLDAMRHLVLPVVTLSLMHWATLGRVTRAAMIEELDQPYVTAALAKGLSQRIAVWRHALRNAILPGLNSAAVSIASLITGVFVIETVFGFHGVSELFVLAMSQLDLPLTLGLVVYSALIVLPLMFILDILQAIIDPRLREGVR